MVTANAVGNYGEWQIVSVLILGNDKDYGDHSLAMGYWDKHPSLACRYDVRLEQKSRCGYPNARGLPRWFILPDWMAAAVIDAAPINDSKKAEARAFLAGGKS